MRRTWTWTFDLPPDQLWPVLADTNRFNEAHGPAAVRARGDAATQRHGPAPRTGQGRGFHAGMGGEAVRVDPGRHFRQSRVFTKGPFRRFGPVFDLESDGKGGSRVSYALEWEPLTMVGRLFGARLATQAGEDVEQAHPGGGRLRSR